MEISDINNTYIKSNKLKIIKLNDNVFWSDTGTYESLIETSLFFYNYETKHAKKINCLEEIAYRSGLIDKNKLLNLAFSMKNSQYGQYLIKLHNELK